MKKVKRILNIYNLLILLCVIIVVASLYIIFKPEKQEERKIVTPSGIEVMQANVGGNEKITEGQARELAVKQFETLNEKVNSEDLNVVEIERDGELYYYITSLNNTLEIKINGGKITRINSATVEE